MDSVLRCEQLSAENSYSLDSLLFSKILKMSMWGFQRQEPLPTCTIFINLTFFVNRYHISPSLDHSSVMVSAFMFFWVFSSCCFFSKLSLLLTFQPFSNSCFHTFRLDFPFSSLLSNSSICTWLLCGTFIQRLLILSESFPPLGFTFLPLPPHFWVFLLLFFSFYLSNLMSSLLLDFDIIYTHFIYSVLE